MDRTPFVKEIEKAVVLLEKTMKVVVEAAFLKSSEYSNTYILVIKSDDLWNKEIYLKTIGLLSDFFFDNLNLETRSMLEQVVVEPVDDALFGPRPRNSILLYAHPNRKAS
jgi:hypothetical protein